MRPIIGGNLLKQRIWEAAPYRRRKPPDRAAAWGRPYSFSGVNLNPGRAGEDTRPYGETGSGSFFFVGAGHRPARIRGAPRSLRPTAQHRLHPLGKARRRSGTAPAPIFHPNRPPKAAPNAKPSEAGLRWRGGTME